MTIRSVKSSATIVAFRTKLLWRRASSPKECPGPKIRNVESDCTLGHIHARLGNKDERAIKIFYCTTVADWLRTIRNGLDCFMDYVACYIIIIALVISQLGT